MAINPLSGSAQPRAQARAVAETVMPNMAQSLLPQDTLGIRSKSKPGNGLSASTRLSDLKPEQKASLGGGSALDSIAEAQPDTTIGEVGPLLRNRGAMESIAGLMQERRDLKVGDFISTDKKGRTQIDPSYKDPKTLEMLKERPDITPSELTAMRQNMTKTMKNPQMGKMASEKAFELLKKRSDLKPGDMSNMMNSFRNSVGGNKQKGQGGDDQSQAIAALDMFDNASKMMGKRTDIGPDQMGELAQSVSNLSSPKDKNGPQSISEGFEAASKSLEKNALSKPSDIAKTAATVGEHFKGGDEKTAGHRMNAFKKSADMMGENSSVDSSSINKMLTQASQRDPKIKDGEGPGRAKRLAKVMDDVSTGVKSGTVNANDLSSHFRNQDAERARFSKDPDNKEAKEKKEGKKPGTEEQNKKAGDAEQTKEAKTDGQTGEAKKAEGEPKVGKSDGDTAGKTETRDVRTESQKEEDASTGVPTQAGQGPTNVDTKTVGDLGPGQAAGTKEAGVKPGAGDSASGSGKPGGQMAQAPIIQPKGKRA